MPTTKPRYTFTDTGHLHELLDAAQRRWPEVPDRKTLLLRLAEAGDRALETVDERIGARERRERVRAALERVPPLLDHDLLLSDRAWS
jgi:hypothetical protein